MEHNIDEKIMRIAHIITENVKNCVEGNDVAIAFSGGLDSTLLAVIAKKYALDVGLYTVFSDERAEDLLYARKVAKQLGLKLNELYLPQQKALNIYNNLKSWLGLDYVKTEILTPIYFLCENVKEDIILFGSGSEEVFLGYRRYYQWIDEGLDEVEIDKRLLEEFKMLENPQGDIDSIRKICAKFDKIACFPFYDKKLVDIAFSIPLKVRALDKEREKYVLRLVASSLNVPQIVVERKKRALQYGSGIHKKLIKLKRKGIIE